MKQKKGKIDRRERKEIMEKKDRKQDCSSENDAKSKYKNNPDEFD